MNANTIAARLSLTCAIAAGLLAPAAAHADEFTTTFEAPGFTAGNIDGQGGWKKTGAALDGAVYAHPAPFAGLGGQSLRVSNATNTGNARWQTHSPDLADEAGEAGAVSAGESGGTRQTRWEASVTLAAFEPSLQPGLALNVAPDRGDGQRTANVLVTDTAAGLRLQSLEAADNGPGQAAGWAYVEVASALDRTVPHTLGLVVDYADGPANDVLRIYVDGALVRTTGTWEQYFRNDPEQAVNGNAVPTADALTVAARLSEPAAPALAGKGLFLDDVRVATSTPAVSAPPAPPTPGPPAPDPPAPPSGPQNITGGDARDVITGGKSNDRLNGGGGDDTVRGGGGSDRIWGALGADLLFGDAGNDVLDGGSGNDKLHGGTGNDRLAGGSGGDRLFGSGGNDRIAGGTGNDRFSGGSGDDRMEGGTGADLLTGNEGRDTIAAGSGDDRVRAHDGRRDRVSCGAGEDAVRADRGDRVAEDCERVLISGG